MVSLVQDILLGTLRGVVWRRASAVALKFLAWLDRKIAARRGVKIALGGALGLVGYVLGAVLAGLLGL